jgi:hypothetical protein
LVERIESVEGMPLYTDLGRRALKARRRAPSRRVEALAKLLRPESAGTVLLRRCAWCERFEVSGEWLRLDGELV